MRKNRLEAPRPSIGWPVALAAASLLAGYTWLRRRRSLRGEVVLVTGGSRGFGLVLARELVDRGAKVAICARDRDELERARADLDARGTMIVAVPCDLADPESVRHMLDEVRACLGPIDVLVNNAGTMMVGPVEEMTFEDYEDAMQVHLWGPVRCVMGVLPEMRERAHGRIVNISSLGGRVGVPHLVPYSASKFAISGLGRSLRAELAGSGITVTTAYPGLMRTGSPRNADFKGQHRKEYAWFALADDLPLLSLPPERVARRLLDAVERGQPEIVIGLPARIMVRAQDLFPNLTIRAMALFGRFLPGPGGVGERAAKGFESESVVVPSPLTALGQRAEHRNNQLPQE